MQKKLISLIIAITAAMSCVSGVYARTSADNKESGTAAVSSVSDVKDDSGDSDNDEDGDAGEINDGDDEDNDKDKDQDDEDNDKDDKDKDDNKDADNEDKDQNDKDRLTEKNSSDSVKKESKASDSSSEKKSESKKSILDELKGSFSGSLTQAKDYINGIKELFKNADAETKKSILAEIAKIKQEMLDETIDVFVKGNAVDFSRYGSVLPMIRNDITLVPLRAIAEALDAEVDWDNDTRTVTVSKDGTVIKLTIGSLTASVNGIEHTLIAAPEISNDRTMLPLRFIMEAMNASVNWDDASRVIEIN